MLGGAVVKTNCGTTRAYSRYQPKRLSVSFHATRGTKTGDTRYQEWLLFSSYKYYLPDKENTPILHTIKSNSVVIIGANGSGKSRLGIWIENNCGDSAHRVAPQRILNPSEYTPLTSYAEAENTVRFGASNFRNKAHKWDLIPKKSALELLMISMILFPRY